MKKWLFLFGFLFNAFIVSAHQPDVSSTILIDQGGNNWVLQIRASLTAFQHEVAYSFPDTTYATPEEFQAMVLQHLKKNIEIRFNENKPVILEQGMVKLGHETIVLFKMPGVPENIHSIFTKNSSFQDIHRNQSTLIVFKEGLTREQFVLNNDNQHQVSLALEGNQLKMLTANAAMPSLPGQPLVWVSVFALVLGVSALLWVKSKMALGRQSLSKETA